MKSFYFTHLTSNISDFRTHLITASAAAETISLEGRESDLSRGMMGGLTSGLLLLLDENVLLNIWKVSSETDANVKFQSLCCFRSLPKQHPIQEA